MQSAGPTMIIVVSIVSFLVEGGSGKQGTVVSVGDATNHSSYRSCVKVKWDADDMTYEYRRGHEGCVDDKCVTAAKGEMYYIDHLPKLGKNELCGL